jgi:hypothetical protein
VNLIDPDGNLWKWISNAGEWIAKNAGYPEGVPEDYSDYLLPLEQSKLTKPKKIPWEKEKDAITDAANRFLEILKSNKNCAGLFVDNAQLVNAPDVFSSMIDNNLIRLNVNDTIPSKNPDGSWSATGGRQSWQFIFIDLHGPFFNPVNTWVMGGSSPTHNFLADWQRQYGMPTMDTNTFQEIMIAHEFGHRMGVLEDNDAGDPEKQKRNTQKIIDSCFK